MFNKVRWIQNSKLWCSSRAVISQQRKCCDLTDFFGNLTKKVLFFAASKNSWICTSSTTTSQAFLKDQIFLTKGQACYRIMTSFCEIDGLIQRRESEVLFCLFPVVLSQINLIGWQLAMKIESFNFRPSFLGLRGSFRSFECVTMREENCMIKCF